MGWGTGLPRAHAPGLLSDAPGGASQGGLALSVFDLCVHLRNLRMIGCRLYRNRHYFYRIRPP